MRRDDPLEMWDIDSEFRRALSPEQRAQFDAQARGALDHLQEFLDQPPKRRNLWDVRLGLLHRPYGLPHDQVTRAQELYRRIVQVGGIGNVYAQETLLELIAATEDPNSIPFWLDLVNLARPRDTFSARRRTIALAALARLALDTESPEAYAALRQLTRHTRPDIRALAVYYLGRAYLDAERPLPDKVIAELSEMALRDTAFEPRFQARALLRHTRNAVPLDNPGGAYAFKVKYKWDKSISRTLELKSEQSLEDLHFAIQHALGWDSDHLYSFFMNAAKWDERYGVASPDEQDKPPWTDEVVIGELGLTLKHKFLYLFDYGDNHEFEIQVVGIHPQVESGKYPRVIESEGMLEQYRSWDDSQE